MLKIALLSFVKVSVETVSSSDADGELGSGLNKDVWTACVHTRAEAFYFLSQTFDPVKCPVRLFICYFRNLYYKKAISVEERVFNFREGILGWDWSLSSQLCMCLFLFRNLLISLLMSQSQCVITTLFRACFLAKQAVKPLRGGSGSCCDLLYELHTRSPAEFVKVLFGDAANSCVFLNKVWRCLLAGQFLKDVVATSRYWRQLHLEERITCSVWH